MVDVVDRKTEEQWKQEYRTYPSVTPDGFATFHQSRIEPIAYEIPLGAKVLDVGCNDGEFMKLLNEKRDCDVYGVDVSGTALNKAKEKVDADRLFLIDGEKLPFKDNTFDVVTLNEVLVHLIHPERMIKEIRRVLKRGGILLGSTPHANLERHVWDDKRMHHRYLDEAALRDILEPSFPLVYVRTLKGAQFAVSLAQSFLADKPAEMLFKAGGRKTHNWEVDLMDDEKTRVWFGYTQLAGTIYYRMLGYADKMDSLGLVQTAYERTSYEHIDEKARHWQANIRSKIILGQLENILRVAHVSVWQIALNRDVLAFLRCAKDLANGPWYQATGRKKYFVTEIDDNLFDVPAYNIASHPYQPHTEMEWIAQEQIKMSDAVICSTQFLVDKIKAMFPDKPIHLVPNSLDFDLWDNLKPTDDIEKKADGVIRIGYTGCSNHRQDLEAIREPLCAILEEFPNVQFLFTPQPEPSGTFMGWAPFTERKQMGLVAKWVQIDKYPNYLAGWGLDIGIAPLKDNDFNRAKSNLRWLEYSGMKIPTVASRVYPFKNSIRHGEDGLVCNSSQEWYESLKMLIVDVRRRKEIGDAAYERVKRDFNMTTIAKQYAEILSVIKSTDS